MSDVTAGDRKTAKVFVSYARLDREVAGRLADVLRGRGFTVLRDTDDILPTEEWRGRLRQLIVEADAVVFLLSPRSAVSEVCAWEVEVASSLGKKIAPIVVEDVAGSQIPPLLSRLNYIFATVRDRFENAVDSLCDALGTDIEWIREHTRMVSSAVRWNTTGRRPEALLHGQELREGERWLAARPASVPTVTAICSDYLAASLARREDESTYARVRLQALEGLVAPILKVRLAELEAKAAKKREEATRTGFMRDSADSLALETNLDTIRNFLSDDGAWHPQPPKVIQTLGPQDDYADVFQFPCCRLTIRGDVVMSPVSQFRADGCQRRP